MTLEELMQIESYLLDRKKPDYEISRKIMKALDLINRLEEENANYSRNNRSLTEAVTEMQTALKKQSAEIERLRPYGTQVEVSKKIESEIKAEAIKEFAERFKGKYRHYTTSITFLVTLFDNIDNLVKEMVGDAE